MAYCPLLLGGVTVIDLIHVLDELEDLVGVADLVIVPADDLDKVSVRAMPAVASKMEVRESPRKSEETTASSV